MNWIPEISFLGRASNVSQTIVFVRQIILEGYLLFFGPNSSKSSNMPKNIVWCCQNPKSRSLEPESSLVFAALLAKDFKKTHITLTKKLQRFAYHR